MKIHPDWSSNGSVAITFDDDGEDAAETYSDFSRLLKHFNISFTTFKLRGSTTASMVVPITAMENTSQTENVSSSQETEREEESTDVNNDTDDVVVKKKKKKVSN